jgi:hypothetical protein
LRWGIPWGRDFPIKINLDYHEESPLSGILRIPKLFW